MKFNSNHCLPSCRGFAHVGILKALEEYGIQFDMVGGTSIGAFIGGLYGQNQDADKLRELIRPWSKVRNDAVLVN